MLAASDYQERDTFLAFVGEKRAPRVARHWAHLLQPLVPYGENGASPLRFRQIEYYRMPIMSYLTIDRLDMLTAADHVRLALATAPGDTRDELPYSERFLADFEQRHCYDRFYTALTHSDRLGTRFLGCGHAFAVVSAGNPAFQLDGERGLLGQFRQQLFLLFMIAHFHKSALLMLSDQLVAATKLLDPGRPSGLEDFRRETYRLQASFLRFTQRYYVSEVSDQAHARDLFRMHRTHLATEELFREVRSEIFDNVQYLDSTMLRRQSGSMHRLTAVTTLGLIGTTATGFLGMNLIAEADNPLVYKITYFSCVVVVVTLITLATVAASRTLTRMFDRLTEGRGRGES